jgi:hypothetical protein
VAGALTAAAGVRAKRARVSGDMSPIVSPEKSAKAALAVTVRTRSRLYGQTWRRRLQ